MSALPVFDDVGQRELSRREQIRIAGLLFHAAKLRRDAHALDMVKARIEMDAGDDCARLAFKHSHGDYLYENEQAAKHQRELARLTNVNAPNPNTGD
jgi:hypothetical protein